MAHWSNLPTLREILGVKRSFVNVIAMPLGNMFVFRRRFLVVI